MTWRATNRTAAQPGNLTGSVKTALTRCRHVRGSALTGSDIGNVGCSSATVVPPGGLHLPVCRESEYPSSEGSSPNLRSFEGHGAEAHRLMGARAVPAGGFAVRSRAAWASCLPAL